VSEIKHVYEVRPRRDKRGVDLISDVLPFGRLWYDTPNNAIGYATHSSRSHDAVIRVYDDAALSTLVRRGIRPAISFSATGKIPARSMSDREV
jgi:hypothetical protein